ncbi:putative phage tail protein [Brachyspira sp.]|uniref:putative phage tail protein n=1 Tax=Brachyspira sp. TaxID=1977261 RepID=UPI003D7F07D0
MAYNKKYFELIKKLLPKSKLWKLLDTKYLNKFFRALTSLFDDVRKYIDSIYLDLFPDSTRSLELWEEQYAIINPDKSEEIRRNTIAMRWKDKGGQSAYYMQKILQENGFDVFVYENNPITDPNSFLDNDDDQNQVIVNGFVPRVTEIRNVLICCQDVPREALVYCSADGKWFCGNEEAISGYYKNDAGAKWFCGNDRAVCGYFENYIEFESEDDIPTNEKYFPFCFFVGGKVERDASGRITKMLAASIPFERLDYFRRLILSLKPAQTWCIIRMRIN